MNVWMWLAFINPLAWVSDQVPAAPQSEPIMLTGATLHTLSGGVIADGAILFENGKITALGDSVPRPINAKVIDVGGKHIYPGLIDAVTHLGLWELGAVPATVDRREIGPFNPNVYAERAINPDSEHFPVVRSGGVAYAGVVPEGDLLAGQAALIRMDGWTYEDLTLRGGMSMVLYWPTVRPWGDRKKQETANAETMDQFNEFVRRARQYKAQMDTAISQGGTLPEQDARLNAMLPLLNKEMPLWVFANSVGQITESVAWTVAQGFSMVLVGGAAAPELAPLLKRYDIPVVVAPVFGLPYRRDEGYDQRFTIPKRLHQAGVRFCISSWDDTNDNNDNGLNRNLGHHAGWAAAYGLPKDEALRSVTLSAAEILGVSRRLGSLEPGKDASLIVCDGDPLEPSTRVEMMFIEGRQVDLDNRHEQLYRKYRTKYERQN